LTPATLLFSSLSSLFPRWCQRFDLAKKKSENRASLKNGNGSLQLIPFPGKMFSSFSSFFFRQQNRLPQMSLNRSYSVMFFLPSIPNLIRNCGCLPVCHVCRFRPCSSYGGKWENKLTGRPRRRDPSRRRKHILGILLPLPRVEGGPWQARNEPEVCRRP